MECEAVEATVEGVEASVEVVEASVKAVEALVEAVEVMAREIMLQQLLWSEVEEGHQAAVAVVVKYQQLLLKDKE